MTQSPEHSKPDPNFWDFQEAVSLTQSYARELVLAKWQAHSLPRSPFNAFRGT